MNLAEFGIYVSKQFVESGGGVYPVTVFTRGENEIVSKRELSQTEIDGIIQRAENGNSEYSLFFRIAMRLCCDNLI